MCNNAFAGMVCSSAHDVADVLMLLMVTIVMILCPEKVAKESK